MSDLSIAVSPELTTTAAEFDAVLRQVDQLAGDASFLGVNLLAGDSPLVQVKATGMSSLTLTGANSRTADLGIARAANGFGTSADIAAASANLNATLGFLRNFSSRLSSESSVAETSRGFTSELRNVLQTEVDKLTLADPNEDGVALLALQTCNSFAAVSFSIIQNSESGILRLFG